MNRKQEMIEAKKHQGEGQCYIKAEDRELLVSGDMIAIIRSVERIITRVGDISGEGFSSTWLAVRDMHNLNPVKSEVMHNGVATPTDRQVTMIKIRDLEELNEKLTNDIAEHKRIIREIKKKCQTEVAERDARIQALTKELNQMEHRLQEMEDGFLLGHGRE